MLEMTGASYRSAAFAKALMMSDAKTGKTCFLVASSLGVLPWQKNGGIVDKPENLFVLTFDANALGGVNKFLIDTCGAPKEALNYTVFNMQDDLRKLRANDIDYDLSFYNTVVQTIDRARQKAKGTPVFIISSLTGLADGIERGVVGPPGGPGGTNPKGYSDRNKWQLIAHQINELRNYCQVDVWHCLWEAHLHKRVDDNGTTKDSIQVSGKAGEWFSWNVEQLFRIQRQFNQKFPGTNCDQVFINTRPALSFAVGGRGYNECLNEKEPCMTVAFEKSGLQVGHWGAKSAPVKAVSP